MAFSGPLFQLWIWSKRKISSTMEATRVPWIFPRLCREQNKERPRVVGQRDDGPEAEGRGAVRERKGSHENQGCAPAGVGCEVREHEERGEHQRHHRALPLIIFI